MKQVSVIVMLTGLLSAAHAETGLSEDKPIDPFDYNFCGGERVYPIVGINFATACGPRNQVALGRRGKLMWLFPGQKKQGKLKGANPYKGQLKLSKEQLAKFSTLAEVARITDETAPRPHKVLYKMGINFSGRRPKYIFSAYDKSYTPSNELFKHILASVPDTEKPYLPDCGEETRALFNPTLSRQQKLEQQQTSQLKKMAKKNEK